MTMIGPVMLAISWAAWRALRGTHKAETAAR